LLFSTRLNFAGVGGRIVVDHRALVHLFQAERASGTTKSRLGDDSARAIAESWELARAPIRPLGHNAVDRALPEILGINPGGRPKARAGRQVVRDRGSVVRHNSRWRRKQDTLACASSGSAGSAPGAPIKPGAPLAGTWWRRVVAESNLEQLRARFGRGRLHCDVTNASLLAPATRGATQGPLSPLIHLAQGDARVKRAVHGLAYLSGAVAQSSVACLDWVATAELDWLVDSGRLARKRACGPHTPF